MFSFVFMVLFILGLAVKQSAFILLHGSVFDWLRVKIKRKMIRYDGGAKGWYYAKMQELFTCNLCMTSQVSFWNVTVPLTVLAHLRWDHPVEIIVNAELSFLTESLFILLFMFIVTMAISAVAMGIWGVTEYFPKKREEERKLLKEIMNSYSANLYSNYSAVISGVQESEALNFTKDDFNDLIYEMDLACLSIGCSYSRRDCRENKFERWFNAWAEKQQITYVKLIRQAKAKTEKAMQVYYSKYKLYDDGSTEVDVFKEDVYTTLSESLTT